MFRRRRELLTELARAGAEATVELVRRQAGVDLRPGLVVSLATAGDLLQWHPHLHILASDGGFAADGAFDCLGQWDATLLMSLLRERLLARLLERHALFHSAHVGERIEREADSVSKTLPPTSFETPLAQEARVPRRPQGRPGAGGALARLPGAGRRR